MAQENMCKKQQTYRNNNKTSTIHLYRGNIRNYIIDLMATLRTFNTIPETYELLKWELIEADTNIAIVIMLFKM